MTRPGSGNAPWAVCAAVTQEMLNDLVLFVVGDGVALDPVETDVALPGMGDIRLKVGLTINGGSFDLHSDDGGRVRATATAAGQVDATALGFDGSSAPVASMLPAGPVQIPVRVEALVDPVVELKEDLTVTVGLSVHGGQLVGVTVDDDAPAPEGVDPDAWAGMTQMFNMLFATMGEQLWEALGEHVGVVGNDAGEDVGAVLSELGVVPGRAEIRVTTGLLTIGLPGDVTQIGRASPVPVAGSRIAVSLAQTGVHRLAAMLLPLVAGGRPLPFEIEVDLGDQRVRGTIRQTRILSDRVPDLRMSLRTDLSPRLTGGRLEIALRAAWVELPSLFPSFVNDLSRQVGSRASLAPLKMRFPAVIQVPVGAPPEGGESETVGIQVDDLRVTSDGVGIVVGLA